MAVELRIVSGARAGTREQFEKSVVTIGRHPISDLRFDLEKDLDVSTRHAELRTVGSVTSLHDLNSTNGSFVNGQRVAGERALFDGDIISFGANGPQVEFRTSVAAATVASAAPPRRDTTARIAEAVEEQTGRLKQMIVALAVLVVLGVGTAWFFSQRGVADARAQMAELIAMNDSLAKALEARLSQTGLAESALQAARAESEQLSKRLREGGSNGAELAALTAEARAASARRASLATMDFSAVAQANQRAVVFVIVEMPDGSVSSGSGFNVTREGLVVTNRHVVQATDGTRAAKLAVAFDGTQRWVGATIERVSDTDELAILRLTAGNYPVIAGIARENAPNVGAPVVVLGYPLGTGTAGMGGDINRLRPAASLGVGTVSKTLEETLQLDAFAAQGSSGSPVFDARGFVVGVVYGGATESAGRIVYAVPAARLAAQLPADAAGILR